MADCECFDFDESPEAWYYWFAVCKDEDDCDYDRGSFYWYEAVEMANDMYAEYPNTQIVTVDYRDNSCIEVEPYREILKARSEY